MITEQLPTLTILSQEHPTINDGNEEDDLSQQSQIFGIRTKKDEKRKKRKSF